MVTISTLGLYVVAIENSTESGLYNKGNLLADIYKNIMGGSSFRWDLIHLPNSYVQQQQGNFLFIFPIPLTVTINPVFHFDLLGSPFLTVLVLDLRSLAILRGEKKRKKNLCWYFYLERKIPLLETVTSSCSFIFHWFWLRFMLTPNFAARKQGMLIG